MTFEELKQELEKAKKRTLKRNNEFVFFTNLNFYYHNLDRLKGTLCYLIDKQIYIKNGKVNEVKE